MSDFIPSRASRRTVDYTYRIERVQLVARTFNLAMFLVLFLTLTGSMSMLALGNLLSLEFAVVFGALVVSIVVFFYGHHSFNLRVDRLRRQAKELG